jgi:hypothetical protein
MVKIKDTQFCVKNLKMKRKKDKIPERGFAPQIFINFPAHDLNFHGRDGDKIKSKQTSKRDFNIARALVNLI